LLQVLRKNLLKDCHVRNKYNEVLSGYQPGQVVERWKKQRFEDRLRPCPQGADMVTFGNQPTNQPTNQKAKCGVLRMALDIVPW